MTIKHILKYLFITSIVVIFSCRNNPVDIELQQQVTAWYYTFSLANIHNDEALSARYANVIERESCRVNVPSGYFSRQTWIESRYMHWRTSKVTCKRTGDRIEYAVGSMGVVGKLWSHLLYTDDNAKLRDYLNKQKLKCLSWSKADQLTYMNNLHHKYLKRIGYNIYAGAQILRWNLNKFDQNYVVATTSYWAGPYSSELKALVKKNVTNDYAKKACYTNVFNTVMASNEIKFGYDWNYPTDYTNMLVAYNKYHKSLTNR